MGTTSPACLIGFGELGSVFAERMVAAGVPEVRALMRSRTGPRARAVIERMRAAGVRPCVTPADAIRGATVVVSAVPASAADEVAGACAQLLDRGALYVDVSAAEPERKAAAADAIGRAGGAYADVAVMGTVVTSGHAVPMIASGPGASAWEAFAGELGMSVRTVDGPPGQASLLKLLRSVYMKGRDALVVETLLAARRYGVERELLPTIAGPGEEVPFAELAERVLCALALHAGRRADELEASARLLRSAGVEPLMASAAAERLRTISGMGLTERFAGRRPDDLETVLDAIDERSGPAGGQGEHE